MCVSQENSACTGESIHSQKTKEKISNSILDHQIHNKRFKKVRNFKSPIDKRHELTPHVKTQLTPGIPKFSKKNKSQMYLAIGNVACECNWFSISYWAAVVILNDVMVDLQLALQTDRSGIVDRSKIRREQANSRYRTQSFKSIGSLYFDSRKDNTRTLVNKKWFDPLKNTLLR